MCRSLRDARLRRDGDKQSPVIGAAGRQSGGIVTVAHKHRKTRPIALPPPTDRTLAVIRRALDVLAVLGG